MNLRPLTRDDLPVLAAMRDEAAAEFLADRWADGILDPMFGARGYLASRDGKPLGAVVFNPALSDDDANASLLVSPDARGVGVGAELLRRGIREAGLRRCTGNIGDKNVASRRCAERAGFVEVF